MGQSTRRSLYRAVLILVISIENYILCEPISEEDSTEYLEPGFNVLPYVNNGSPRDKLMNTLLTVAAEKGVLPETYSETRPMWPQRPWKPTQFQTPPSEISIQPQQYQFDPSTSQTVSFSQNPFTVSRPTTSVFPEAIQFGPNQNFASNQEQNYISQANGVDHNIVLFEPTQNNFEYDKPNFASHGVGSVQANIIPSDEANNPSLYPFTETLRSNTIYITPDNLNSVPLSGYAPASSNAINISPEYFNSVPFSGYSPVLTDSNQFYPVMYPSFINSPENNVMLPPIFPAPAPFAPITFPPPFMGSPPNMLPSNSVTPSIIIINPAQSNCICDDPKSVTLEGKTSSSSDISSMDSSIIQQDSNAQHVPYNIEINLPILTRLIPAPDSGSSADAIQMPPSPVFYPTMDYPPYPIPPPPMPFLPPIIIQGSKSKSNNLLTLLLLSRILPVGSAGSQNGNNCGCSDYRYIPVPYPIPFPTNNPIVIE